MKTNIQNIYQLAKKSFFSVQTNDLREKLKSYHNIHLDKKCVIIGNGKSVDMKDLAKLQQAITFCCNRFYLCYNDTKFRADYTVCVDPQMIRDFGKEMAENCQNTLFLSDKLIAKENSNVEYFYRYFSTPFKFSDDISEYISMGSSVINIAIQIATFMGVKEIYLYGIDHDFQFNKSKQNNFVEGDNNHFIKNYRNNKPWYPPKIDQIESSFAISKKYLESKDIKIANISRKTKLKVFNLENFDDIF